jgi:hypothetical protein
MGGTCTNTVPEAAIGDASVPRIPKDLSYQPACNTSVDSMCESWMLDSRLVSSSKMPARFQSDLALSFLIVTDGPIHKLW